MKELKNLSLFKIAILLTINIFSNNIFIFFLTVVYLLLNNKKQLIIFISLLSLLYLSNYINSDFIKVGIVETKYSNSILVDKLLYKTRVYTNKSYDIGDIVLFKDESKYVKDKNTLKNNIRFTYNSDLNIIYKYRIRNIINERINEFDDLSSSYLKKIVLNENTYDTDINSVGLGFCFYYLIVVLNRKNRLISFLILVLYTLIFGFEIKFYLLFTDFITSLFKFNNINKLSIKLIVILFINKYLLFNYSIIISLLFSFYYLSELKNDLIYIAFIESLFFNEISIFITFFYNYLIIFRVIIFLLSLITLIFKPISSVYLFIIKTFNLLINNLNFSIRGRITIVWIIILLMIFKKFMINNKYLKLTIVCLVLLLPISNPFKHVSFIDVGQGDSILIKDSFNKANILIDTGSNFNYYKLKRWLYKEGIYKLDYLIISHDDEDHSGNLEALKKDFKIKEIVQKGKDISIGDINLKNIYLGNFDNENDNSLVYLLEFDKRQFLFTGDISSSIENKIVNDLDIKNIDVLKVSHHGSNTASSNYFIGMLNPKFAVISTSGKYNHPSKEVINTLNSYFINTFITKDSGTITFYLTNILDLIKTEINEFVII